MQQWRQLKATGIEEPNPRQQLLDDLTQFISDREAEGHEIILMMDANSPIEEPAIHAFMDANNLHDLMEEFLPDEPPPTYKRGTTKIDHILGTIGIVFAMTGAGIIPFGNGPNSDHAILHIDFSLETLCGTPSTSLVDPTHPASRNLWSTDIKAAEAYIEEVRHGFAAENIVTRIAILTSRCHRTA